MRHSLLVLLLLPTCVGAALTLAACGGGGDGTSPATVNGQADSAGSGQAEDPFTQLRFVLGKFPYRAYYRDCLIREVEKRLSAGELEELAELPEEQARRVALRYALGASPKCEQKGQKPIDPKADKVEVQLLRLGYATTLEALGKREGLSGSQASCLSGTISHFPDQRVIDLGNASEDQREKILVSVIEGCAS